MPKFREIWGSNCKKTPKQMAGRKDRHTLFHRILPATARVLTSTTAVDWHVKVKDTKYNVGLTKNYFITVSMQKISSIHTLVLRESRFEGLMNYINGHLHFWPCLLKISEITFSFPEFTPASKNQFIPSIHSWHLFILEIESILESYD